MTSHWSCDVCHVALKRKHVMQDVAKNGDMLRLCPECYERRDAGDRWRRVQYAIRRTEQAQRRALR